MKIGYKLIELRKSTGKTQKEVADFLQIGKSTLGNWENDSREPNFEMLKKLSEFYDVPIAELFGEKSTIVNEPLKETFIEDIIDLLAKNNTLPDISDFDLLDKDSQLIIKSAVNKYLEKITQK